jgi:hypothetical protein
MGKHTIKMTSPKMSVHILRRTSRTAKPSSRKKNTKKKKKKSDPLADVTVQALKEAKCFFCCYEFDSGGAVRFCTNDKCQGFICRSCLPEYANQERTGKCPHCSAPRNACITPAIALLGAINADMVILRASIEKIEAVRCMRDAYYELMRAADRHLGLGRADAWKHYHVITADVDSSTGVVASVDARALGTSPVDFNNLHRAPPNTRGLCEALGREIDTLTHTTSDIVRGLARLAGAIPREIMGKWQSKQAHVFPHKIFARVDKKIARYKTRAASRARAQRAARRTKRMMRHP